MCDDLYTTGDLSGYITCQTSGQMIFEHEWEPPQEVGDAVLAEHPGHTNSYAPALVTDIIEGSEPYSDDGGDDDEEERSLVFKIRFYDGICTEVDADDCVVLSKDRYSYESLVESVKAIEDEKIGVEVVCRDDDNGLFFRGNISKVARQSIQLAAEEDGPDAKT